MNRRRPLDAATLFLLIAAFFQAVQIVYWIAWIRPLWPMPRFPGLAQNPNNQAFILLIGLAYSSYRRKWRCCSLGLLLLLLTGSRVNIMAAFVGLIVLMLFNSEIRRSMLRPLSYMAVIGYMALGFAGPVTLMQSSTGGTVIVPATPIMRWELYRLALTLWRDHPLFGAGAGAYPKALAATIATFSDPYVYDHAHSLWLQAAAEHGAVGLAGWLLAAFALSRRAISQLYAGKAAGAALVASALFSLTFDYYFWFVPTLIILALVAHQMLWRVDYADR